AGSTTATSSRIRTKAWRVGTTSRPDDRKESVAPHHLGRGRSRASPVPGGGRRADLPGAEGAREDRAEAEGPVPHLHGVQEEGLRLPHDPGGREQGQGGRQGQG